MQTFEEEVREFFRNTLGGEIAEDTHVHTQSEWLKRGEEYGNQAPFVITTEGPFYEIYNYGSYGDIPFPTVVDEFHAIARKHGYYFEQGYAWMIYPCQ